ncbi:unnamed protein product [Caenorhabditis sp. 36 PRJEB53466]|nr:unnamed protein product [Caenorhabditis sp. 36 PRJEB53466]
MIILLLVTGTLCGESKDMFKFRKSTLAKFNDARRILASGDISKLLKPFQSIPQLKKMSLLKDNILGPAANMYKLKWNRQLEQLGYEYMKGKQFSVGDMDKTLEYKEHLGFIWLGDIFTVVKQILNFLPLDALKQSMNDFLSMLETLIIALWMAWKAPKSWPIKKGEHFAPAEALFAARHDIGCFSNLYYSVCFVEKIEYQETTFKVGVPCTSCPTHCEFWTKSDDSIEEGELCVAPKGDATAENFAEVAGFITSLFLTAFIYLFVFVRR